jgi:transposase
MACFSGHRQALLCGDCSRRSSNPPCATRRQTTADWIGAQIGALEFFGGVPRLIVPDQARALIKNPDRYDPQPNALYDEFAAHYGCALLAARPAHPRDKPKVENAS